MEPIETETRDVDMARTAFAYAALDAETRIVLLQKTSEIRERMRLTVHEVVEIGERLFAVQRLLAHGQWEAWLQHEFTWSDQTARRYMHVARTFGGKQHLAAFAPSALYALAAPSIPEAARAEAFARAEAGEAITHTLARQIIAQHQPEPAAAREMMEGDVQIQQIVEFEQDDNLVLGLPEAAGETIDTQYFTTPDLGAQLHTLTTADVGTAPQMRQAVERIGTVGFSQDENRASELFEVGEYRLTQEDTRAEDQAVAPRALTAAGGAVQIATQRALAQPAAPPRLCESCDHTATTKRLIGGVLAWRCDACARLDAQMAALGLGGDSSATAAWTHWVALGRILAREDACLYAVQLLRTLAPLIAQAHTDNPEALRAAIARLRACEAGSEAAHWLAAGWALLDVEPPDDAPAPGLMPAGEVERG
jgi:hypothetical protein